MPLLALGIYLSGLFLAFGVRSLVLHRRTGDTGLRLDAGAPGSIGWWAKLSFIVALALGVGGPIASLSMLEPVGFLDVPALQYAGLVVAVCGVIATLLAQLNMGTSWRIGVNPEERTALVTSRAFGVVRNPIFGAMIVTSVGLALMVPNVVSLAATALLVASIQVQVRAIEEPYLARVHGESYDRYTDLVGRFVPSVGRSRSRG